MIEMKFYRLNWNLGGINNVVMRNSQLAISRAAIVGARMGEVTGVSRVGVRVRHELNGIAWKSRAQHKIVRGQRRTVQLKKGATIV